MAVEHLPPRSFPTRPRTAGPLGWLLVLLTGVLLPLATWNLYPDGAGGMRAGFRDLGIALLLLLSCGVLRCQVRRGPWLSLTGVGGALLVLEAALVPTVTEIRTCEALAGAAVLLGAVLQLTQDDG